MSSGTLRMRCQRCGEQMQMRDPEPGGPWKPDQFWVCPRCGRHFWTTYPAEPKPRDAGEPVPPKAP
jgi:rRNA maturation protein Nop10